MSKVLQDRSSPRRSLPEAADAEKIVRLVNEAIKRPGNLSRGLLPVVSESEGLMSALKRWSAEVERPVSHLAAASNARIPC